MINRPPASARCLEIRERLPDFSANRLGQTATGEVQGHLLSCEACSEVFGELLMEEVERGAVPLLTPPRIPPIEWYDAYMRAESGRFGTFWKSVRYALQTADSELRQWARERRDEIERALDALVPPEVSGEPVRVRGAVRTRGAVQPAPPPQQPPPAEIAAEVVSSEGDPTGAVVRFRIDEPPRVTADRHFRLALSTDDETHDEHVVICTLALSGNMEISFTGTITGRPGQRVREVLIDEPGMPGRPRAIPQEHVTVAVVAS